MPGKRSPALSSMNTIPMNKAEKDEVLSNYFSDKK
jgi:hypothetical protein